MGMGKKVEQEVCEAIKIERDMVAPLRHFEIKMLK